MCIARDQPEFGYEEVPEESRLSYSQYNDIINGYVDVVDTPMGQPGSIRTTIPENYKAVDIGTNAPVVHGQVLNVNVRSRDAQVFCGIIDIQWVLTCMGAISGAADAFTNGWDEDDDPDFIAQIESNMYWRDMVEAEQAEERIQQEKQRRIMAWVRNVAENSGLK